MAIGYGLHGFNSTKVQLERCDFTAKHDKFAGFNSTKVQLEQAEKREITEINAVSIPLRYN